MKHFSNHRKVGGWTCVMLGLLLILGVSTVASAAVVFKSPPVTIPGIPDPDPAAMDGGHFGNWAAMDGDTIAVAAPYWSRRRGRVSVYVNNTGTWVKQADLDEPRSRSQEGNGFGTGLSLHGDTLVIAAPWSQNVSGTGAAWIFVRQNGQWSIEGILAPPPPRSPVELLEPFGLYHAFQGSSVFVSFAEAVLEYRKQGGIWGLVNIIQPRRGTVRDIPGGSVAVAGNRLAALGVSGDNKNSLVFIFTNLNGTWTQTQVLDPGVKFSPGGLTELAFDGETILASYGEQKVVKVFGRTAAGFVLQDNWYLDPYTGQDGSRLGLVVRGDFAAVGESWNSRVRFFRKRGMTWRVEAAIQDRPSGLGASLDIVETDFATLAGTPPILARVLAGSPMKTINGLLPLGAALLYEISEAPAPPAPEIVKWKEAVRNLCAGFGGGWTLPCLTPGAMPPPGPPRRDFTIDDAARQWEQMPQPQRDFLVGRLLQEASTLVQDPRDRQDVERAGNALVNKAAPVLFPPRPPFLEEHKGMPQKLVPRKPTPTLPGPASEMQPEELPMLPTKPLVMPRGEESPSK